MQRVMIVGAGDLFDEGLRRLLSQEHTGLDVLNVAYESDAGILRLLLEWRPDTIVLFEGGPLTVSRVFELINSVSDLMFVRVITALTRINPAEFYEEQPVLAGNQAIDR
ncbi:MAG: hypothetical protein HYZ49_02965 [Chloroflexi bacterium]|nr:hypothetical protein [Chloroflexota bacterium]